ncbi:hypothetical protein NL676_027249 [Syzygium grande]|nr:hypothetical protein NL676_027249 [Syzygium grande]
MPTPPPPSISPTTSFDLLLLLLYSDLLHLLLLFFFFFVVVGSRATDGRHETNAGRHHPAKHLRFPSTEGKGKGRAENRSLGQPQRTPTSPPPPHRRRRRRRSKRSPPLRFVLAPKRNISRRLDHVTRALQLREGKEGNFLGGAPPRFGECSASLAPLKSQFL